jgi:hypothetical protein
MRSGISSEFHDWSLWLIGIYESELNLSDANKIECEAIEAECFEGLFVSDELKFLSAREDLQDAVARDDVGHVPSRRTASLDQSI